MLLALPFPNLDPILIQLGPFAIRWYALAYIVGILLGWLYARAIIRNQKRWGGPAPMTVTDFDDFIVWVTLGVILGGRLGYVLFYNPGYFSEHPLEALQLWKGGMSFHGGFTGCVVAVVLFAKSRAIPVLSLGDVTCAVGPSGCSSGGLPISSMANCGAARPTRLGRWCFRPAGRCRAIRAALRGGAGRSAVVLVLAFLVRGGALKRPGLIIGAFAVGYALTRSFAELFREPDPQLGFLWGGLTMGMLLSLPLLLFGIVLIVIALRRPPRNAAHAM